MDLAEAKERRFEDAVTHRWVTARLDVVWKLIARHVHTAEGLDRHGRSGAATRPPAVLQAITDVPLTAWTEVGASRLRAGHLPANHETSVAATIANATSGQHRQKSLH